VHTLYGYKGSGSAAVEIALAMASIPYELIEAASWVPESANDALKAHNPLGQIPTLLLPDGTVLTESAAILMHLGLTYPESKLLPSSPSQRARVLRGLVYIAANCYAAIGVIDFPERWNALPDEVVNERVKAGATARLHEYWSLFADQFDANPYLGGEQPNALDILAVVVSKWSGARKHLREARPAFFETLLLIERHPAVVPVMQRYWPQ